MPQQRYTTEQIINKLRQAEVLGQPRSAQRYRVQRLPDEEPFTVRVCEIASEYGRYGYRRVTALLRSEGWRVNHKRVERIWRQAG